MKNEKQKQDDKKFPFEPNSKDAQELRSLYHKLRLDDNSEKQINALLVGLKKKETPTQESSIEFFEALNEIKVNGEILKDNQVNAIYNFAERKFKLEPQGQVRRLVSNKELREPMVALKKSVRGKALPKNFENFLQALEAPGSGALSANLSNKGPVSKGAQKGATNYSRPPEVPAVQAEGIFRNIHEESQPPIKKGNKSQMLKDSAKFIIGSLKKLTSKASKSTKTPPAGSKMKNKFRSPGR